MGQPFIGSEAVACGRLTRHALRSRYVAVHPDIYVAGDVELDAVARARAAWLWSRRRGIVAGRSASALHGAKWVDNRAPAELLLDYRRPPKGSRTWADCFDEDDVQLIA
ncbi:MAG: hypothetical protein WBF82_15235, partial [Mycobacterium sp.]